MTSMSIRIRRSRSTIHNPTAVLGRSFPIFSASTLPGPEDITRVQLPNGIVILGRMSDSSPSVVISGHLPAGSLLDPDEKLGLADFTASALMRGTAQRDFQQIYDALESVGASLGFDSGTHTVSFSAKALVEDLDLVLALLSESLQQPVFPLEQVERLRAQLLTGLAIRAQDTADMASLTFDQLVYANHPYRRPEDGFIETVQAITRQDLIAFHQRHYGPQGMVLCIVGGVKPDVVADKVAAALGGWQNPEQVLPPALPELTMLEQTVSRKVDIPGKSQADVVIGVAGPMRRSPDYMPAALGNNILGQFGMMGRIGEVVREQAGLAYYASSNLGGGIGPGPWYVSAGVDPDNLQQAIELICQEIARFVQDGVTADELADSQANFIGRLPLSMESNAGVAAALLSLERYDLGLDYYRRYAEVIRSIRPEDVLESTQRYLQPDRLAIAIAGP